jgi:hypothetical protein
MVLIKEVPTAEGIEYTFSHYQDAYKKAQRIQLRTGYLQSARKTREGYVVLEPNKAVNVPSRPSAPTSQMPQQMYAEPQQESNIPENLGYETPQRLPPGLYDGKW